MLSVGLQMIPEAVATGENQALDVPQVEQILAQAISQSIGKFKGTEVAVVVDREGNVLGTLASTGAVNLPTPAGASLSPLSLIEGLATVRARTAALFESDGEAFTTRTARFIIQNHFPPGIDNAAGGPLYGVQYSDLIGSDILLPSQTPAVSGDPGGIPLYIHGVAVGGIGVAGDFHDIAATPQLVSLTQNPLYDVNKKGAFYTGAEEYDFDEAVAQAGAKGFMAPPGIRANTIFVGGLRLPFVAEGPARGNRNLSFAELTAGAMAAQTPVAPQAVQIGTIQAGQYEMMNAVIGGVAGLIRDRANVLMSNVAGVPVYTSNGAALPHTNPQDSDAFVNGDPSPNDPAAFLTTDDVIKVISQAVDQATNTRAGIRKPNGVHAEVHVVVVDLNGNVLGAFRMNDGTNFSYDVAVQKARTAAYFSDDQHAFSTRAIGFMSQAFFPPGIQSQQAGPLFPLQNDLNEGPSTLANPLAPVTLEPQLSSKPYGGLADGITIFPGGVPLYKNGHLVGAVGVSGDGVDQDDLISSTGANGFQPAAAIRSDSLPAASITSFISSRISALPTTGFNVAKATTLLHRGLAKVRLPYVKFPRNPGVGH